jgi:cytochrome b561
MLYGLSQTSHSGVETFVNDSTRGVELNPMRLSFLSERLSPLFSRLTHAASCLIEPNTDSSWGAPARFLHWLVAALIFIQFALGWLAVGWRLSPMKLNLFVWHKSTGVVILAIVLLRLLWRLANPTPTLPADTPAWERAAAHMSHGLLYVMMIAMPLTGWIVQSAAGVPFRIFWRIPLPALVSPDKHMEELAALAHFSLGITFTALLVLHVSAALRHHFVKRNNVLTRMLRARRTPL